MASDHPEQNEADQDNSEQNELQQIEDLKIQESSSKQVSRPQQLLIHSPTPQYFLIKIILSNSTCLIS